MPTYATNKTYRGGFYTNKNTNGVNDRVYSAEDVRKPYDVIFSDGLKPDVDGTAGDNLKVSSNGGFSISVNSGFAKLGGAWFENEAPYVITLDNPTASTRYDCVILRNDDSDAVREPSIYIKSLEVVPTYDILERTDDVYEVCLAYIVVAPSSVGFSDSDIVDTRTTSGLCNVMTGVGTTVVRAYRNTYYSESPNQQWLPIGIPQYSKDTDELIVSVNGIVFSEGSQYEIISDVNVKLTIPLPVVGTKIDFVVHKNVNGTASGDVNTEVIQLGNDVTNIKNILSHDYYCNGVDDNIKIGDLVREYRIGSGYGSVKLNIHGTFGAYAPAITGGTTDYWFDFSGTSDRRVVVDFTDCSQIIAPVTDGKISVIFYGKNINLVGANLIVNNTTTDTSIVVFDGSAEIVNCENCRFWITAYKYSYIATTGTFINCRGSVTNSEYYSYCFNTNELLKLIGGEYYAYTGDIDGDSAVVNQVFSNAITIIYGVNAPMVDRSGYYQIYAIRQESDSGYVNCTDLITTLEIDVVSGSSNIRGTIPIDKPGMM